MSPIRLAGTLIVVASAIEMTSEEMLVGTRRYSGGGRRFALYGPLVANRRATYDGALPLCCAVVRPKLMLHMSVVTTKHACR